MLSIGKLVAGAEDYYLSMVTEGKEEYYSGAGESPGTWLGAGTDDLGRAGPVGPEALAAIVAGISPRTGGDRGLPRRSGTRVGGFDLTFSAPKSDSLLYALGCPVHSAAAVRAAHDHAVTKGVAYLERHALFARRGTDGLRRIRTTGLVAAAFVHRTSRNGDPQLHTHVLAANAVLGDDGRWSAPDARGLYAHARTASFVYQASLRAGLIESLGVGFGPVHRGAAELEDVDASVLRRFSTHRAEIEEYLSLPWRALVGPHGRTGGAGHPDTKVTTIGTRRTRRRPAGPVAAHGHRARRGSRPALFRLRAGPSQFPRRSLKWPFVDRASVVRRVSKVSGRGNVGAPDLLHPEPTRRIRHQRGKSMSIGDTGLVLHVPARARRS